jgi:hypothetical protein
VAGWVFSLQKTTTQHSQRPRCSLSSVFRSPFHAGRDHNSARVFPRGSGRGLGRRVGKAPGQDTGGRVRVRSARLSFYLSRRMEEGTRGDAPSLITTTTTAAARAVSLAACRGRHAGRVRVCVCCVRADAGPLPAFSPSAAFHFAFGLCSRMEMKTRRGAALKKRRRDLRPSSSLGRGQAQQLAAAPAVARAGAPAPARAWWCGVCVCGVEGGGRDEWGGMEVDGWREGGCRVDSTPALREEGAGPIPRLSAPLPHRGDAARSPRSLLLRQARQLASRSEGDIGTDVAAVRPPSRRGCHSRGADGGPICMPLAEKNTLAPPKDTPPQTHRRPSPSPTGGSTTTRSPQSAGRLRRVCKGLGVG